MSTTKDFLYRAIVSYDGTDYYGWQLQPDRPTVTGALQDSFRDVFGASPSIVGASRTDAGVHALGQVALIRSFLDIAPDRLLIAWHNTLPTALSIRSLERTTETFHPQRDVASKTYWYHFFIKRPVPLIARYGWLPPMTPDIAKLRECLSVFCGTHDFRSFCTGNDMGDNTVREISSIELIFLPAYNAYRIIVKGPRFMRYMIRRIVGASILVASKHHLDVHYLCRALCERNPRQVLLTAPASGLVLQEVLYTTGARSYE